MFSNYVWIEGQCELFNLLGSSAADLIWSWFVIIDFQGNALSADPDFVDTQTDGQMDRQNSGLFSVDCGMIMCVLLVLM